MLKPSSIKSGELDAIVAALRTTGREQVASDFGRSLCTIDRIARANKIRKAA
jgi:hypothetical protein